MKSFHEVLAPLLVGFTVVKVEKGLGHEGDPAKITCVNMEVTRTFEVWGGIYGPAVSHIQESKGSRPATWTDVGQMFEDIIDYLTHSNDPVVIAPVTDPLTLRMGFRCVETGVEWWVSLVTVKESKFSKKFSTVEGRDALAACLNNCGHGLYTDLG